MNLNYEKVPAMISSKDLDYLSDMFSWNYVAFKYCYNVLKFVSEGEIYDVFDDAIELFDNYMNRILDILEGGNHE